MTSTLVDFHQLIASFVTPERLSLYLRIILILGIGIPLIRFARRLTGKLLKDKLSAQAEMLITRFVYYLGILIILVTVLNEFGFKISALLGVAGVFGLAIGFASQTSVSNIISGIFLISEKPFAVDDFIQIGDTIGMVISIDLLSIKLKTPDNRFVRIPNENMIKTEVTNLTRFDVRRVNLDVSVAYKDDLNKVIKVLKDVAAKEPLALKEPETVVFITSYADSGINLMLGVWGKTEDFFQLRTNLMIGVKESFDAEDIEIPYPHVNIANTIRRPVQIGVNNQQTVDKA